MPEKIQKTIKNSDLDALKQLQEACSSNSAEKTKQAFLNWGRAHWPDKPPLTISELVKLMDSPALFQEAESLNEALYGTHQEKWSGEDFWLAFKDAREGMKQKAEKEKIPVPPLYPQ